jgi:hypothetical protein
MSDVFYYIITGLRMIQANVTDRSEAFFNSICFAIFMN